MTRHPGPTVWDPLPWLWQSLGCSCQASLPERAATFSREDWPRLTGGSQGSQVQRHLPGRPTPQVPAHASGA